MNIDIQEIVDNKIKLMNEDGTIKNTIEKTIENTILKSITDALSAYELKNNIEKQVVKEVSGVVASIGFTAYNSFISNKVKEITEGTVMADVAEKIQKVFDEMLIIKRDSIKLSEIFKEYREWACAAVEESEKYERRYFHVKFEEDEKYHWFNVELALEKPKDRYRNNDETIKFTLHRKPGNTGFGYISGTYIDGYNIKEKIKFGRMSDIESLIVNLTYNETLIEIDIEDEDDIVSSYDVDF